MPAVAAAIEAQRTAGRAHAERARLGALTLGALGIVFGDIGTSPLYTVQAVFAGGRVTPTASTVEGVFSLIVWTLTLVVSVKYLTLVMRADNDGEGGVMALIARVKELRFAGPTTGAALVLVGICGVSLFLGDGMITPAISVLSAVEGVEVAAPHVTALVVPLAVGILIALFAVQRFGTGAVSRLFGPVMAAWFVVLALAGLVQVVAHPAILVSLSPTYALAFVAGHPGTAFVALGAVVLAVTGAEALYADMGHFGRPAIHRAWFGVAFPALALNYLGQGSLLLESPRSAGNPFYLLIPAWGRAPMVLLATIATVIASQALISGAFSLARQAVHLGFLPRLAIVHTSEGEIGQVYLPAVNAVLLTGVLAIVIGFGSAARLAAAYGLAVTGTFVITSVLFLAVARVAWRWSTGRMAAIGGLLLTVDVTFLAANLTKLPQGGWLPVAVAAIAFVVLTTWHRGRQMVIGTRWRVAGPLAAYIDHLRALDPPLQRLPGTAVFLGADRSGTPLALRAHVEHEHALHHEAVVLWVSREHRAHVPADERVELHALGEYEGVVQLTLHFGYMDRPDVPAGLRLAAASGLAADVSNPSYYVSRTMLVLNRAAGMRRWRRRLYLALAKLASDPVEYFALPDDRVVIMGSRVAL